jgi:hypothetical protein
VCREVRRIGVLLFIKKPVKLRCPHNRARTDLDRLNATVVYEFVETRDKFAMDEDKRQAITRMLGTNVWENELYSEHRRTSLFGDEVTEQRNADVKGLEAYVKSRLEVLFPKVFDPLPLPIERRPQRYSLFCAISNADPKAIGLATRIANHILKVGISSKVSPR